MKTSIATGCTALDKNQRRSCVQGSTSQTSVRNFCTTLYNTSKAANFYRILQNRCGVHTTCSLPRVVKPAGMLLQGCFADKAQLTADTAMALMTVVIACADGNIRMMLSKADSRPQSKAKLYAAISRLQKDEDFAHCCTSL